MRVLEWQTLMRNESEGWESQDAPSTDLEVF